jgi:hypothetical protein
MKEIICEKDCHMIQFANINLKGVNLWRLNARQIYLIYRPGLNHGSHGAFVSLSVKRP